MNGKFSQAGVYQKAAIIRRHFRIKVMHLAAQCKTKKGTYPSISKPPLPRVAFSNSKLISIPLSWVHHRISTQTTCHEQSQNEKQCSYGFLWSLYYLIIRQIGLLTMPSYLKKWLALTKVQGILLPCCIFPLRQRQIAVTAVMCSLSISRHVIDIVVHVFPMHGILLLLSFDMYICIS